MKTRVEHIKELGCIMMMRNGCVLVFLLLLVGVGCAREETKTDLKNDEKTTESEAVSRQESEFRTETEEIVDQEEIGAQDMDDLWPNILRREPEEEPNLAEEDSMPAGIPAVPTKQAPKETSLKVVSIKEHEGETRIHVVDEATSRSRFMRSGDVFQGYRLKSIDKNDGKIVLEKDDGESIVTGIPESGGEREIQVRKFPGIVDTSFSTPERIEPTQSELERGIDPNDSDTWPLDYKGPGIERAMGDHGDQIPVDANRADSVLKFDQTQSERRRGIDPNDKKTWPEDYNGPGIERALSK